MKMLTSSMKELRAALKTQKKQKKRNGTVVAEGTKGEDEENKEANDGEELSKEEESEGKEETEEEAGELELR